jgi:hypothetical protein
MRVNRLWWLLFSIVACDKPDGNSLIACPQWAGSACRTTGSAAHTASTAPAGSSSDALGPLERAAAASSPTPATKHRAGGGGGGGGRGGRSTSAATVTPDAAPARAHGRANGVECTYDSDCASSECTYGACASQDGERKLGNGVKCTFSSDCASGECTYGACASNGYDKELGTGVACTYDSDCASHHCTYSKCADD